jgi:hypothetical protein
MAAKIKSYCRLVVLDEFVSRDASIKFDRTLQDYELKIAAALNSTNSREASNYCGVTDIFERPVNTMSLSHSKVGFLQLISLSQQQHA